MVDKEIIKRDEIDILNDACFKSLFRSVEARGMISRFLSAVTGINKERFLNAEYVGGELIKGKLSERGKIADIIIKLDEEDETCIVEMNKYDTGDILEKNLSYAYSVFNEKTRRGIRKWPRVILINIDNFNRFNADEPIIELEMRDKNNKYNVDLVKVYHIVLDNFDNLNYNIDKEIAKFIEFIKTSKFSELKKISRGDNDYMAGYRKVEDLSTDPEFIGYYDYEQARCDDIEMAEYTGLKKGIEQGIKQGVEQGIEQNKKEMIMSMINEGLELDIISKITKLSIEEIKKISNN